MGAPLGGVQGLSRGAGRDRGASDASLIFALVREQGVVVDVADAYSQPSPRARTMQVSSSSSQEPGIRPTAIGSNHPNSP